MRDAPPSPAPDTRTPWICGLAVAVACALAFAGITSDKLWDDEANTAIFARNLLATGELSAWDGRNVIGYRDGAELDAELRNVFMPPLQYGLAAAGIAVLGDDEFGLRAPFVLAGLLCLVALALVARGLFGGRLPAWLPVWILALSPAFLLYIRDARYFAPGAALTVALIACAAGPIAGRGPLAVRAAFAAAFAALLMLTNYFNALGALAALPLLALLPAHRTRRHAVVAAAAFAAAGAVGAWVLATANPFAAPVPRPDEMSGLPRLAVLLWWNLRDLGTFELVPVLLAPALALPFLLRRLAAVRPVAVGGLAAAAMILADVLIVVAFSPQSASRSTIADMRYLVPVLPLGALLTAAAVRVLWELARPAAAAALAAAVFSNALHLGFLGAFNAYLPPKGLQCTLCRYVHEALTDRETATEALVAYVERLPPDEVLLIFPPYMAYAPMYYLPDRRFCCQLRRDHPLTDALRAELPPYVFWEEAEVDRALVNARRPRLPEGPLTIRGHDLGRFRYVDALDIPARDCSRPEIPWHAFPGDDERAVRYHPFFVVEVER